MAFKVGLAIGGRTIKGAVATEERSLSACQDYPFALFSKIYLQTRSSLNHLNSSFMNKSLITP